METEDLVLFVRVAELGSLTAAGRDLRLTPAVVSSRLQRLENRLGVRLLNRTTRQVNLTRDGEVFYEHSIVILERLEAARNAISARGDTPAGALKISAPAAFTRLHVAPHIPAFTARYPDIQVRLNATDRFTDFIAEKVDLAIRIAELAPSRLIVRKLADNRRVLCAAPDYLAGAPALERPEDLLAHNCLLLRFPGSKQYQWTLSDKAGERVTLPVRGAMDADDGAILTDWCLAGHGIALKSLWEVGRHIAAGRLVPVLTDYQAPGHAIYALYPHSRHLPPRVRAFIDFMLETIGSPPYWEKAASEAQAVE